MSRKKPSKPPTRRRRPQVSNPPQQDPNQATIDQLNQQAPQAAAMQKYAQDRVGSVAATIFTQIVAGDLQANTATIQSYVDKSIDAACLFCKDMFGIQMQRRDTSRPNNSLAEPDNKQP